MKRLLWGLLQFGGADEPGPDGLDGLLIDSSGNWFLLIDADNYLLID